MNITLGSIITIHQNSYIVNKFLGEGAFGKTYLVYSPNKDKYAMKVITGYQDTDIEYIKTTFLREINMLKAVRDELSCQPDISCLTDYDVKRIGDGYIFYILMPYYDALNMASFIQKYSLSDHQKFTIMLNSAIALLKLHNIGIIHRDIKPENILVKSTLEIIIIDLGFGCFNYKGDNLKIMKQSNNSPFRCSTQDRVGTALYFSPELIYQEDKPSDFSDIYSLGTTFYFIFFKHDLYEMESIQNLDDIAVAIEKDIHRPIDSKYDKFNNLLLWMTSMYPEDRPTLQIVIQILQELLEDTV